LAVIYSLVQVEKMASAYPLRFQERLILFDGNKTAEQVLGATAGMGATPADIDALVEYGFLALVPGSDKAPRVQPVATAGAAAPSAAVVGPSASGRSEQDRYLDGMKVATQITSSLGLRGFRLNLAVEGAADLKALIELLPKIEAAAGAEVCKPLHAALKG
jgi:hypothetical protein